MGAAAYAEDLVSAFHNIETTFGGQIRALHGYPVCADTVSNQLTIRALMEIEAWLASSDQRRLHSLGRTSEYFTANFLSSKEDNKEKNRSDRWMSVYLPLAWSAQLGNGIVQTITGHRLNRTE